MYSMAKSDPPFCCSSCWQRSGVMDFISPVVSSLSRILASSLRMRPWWRTTGGWPTLMWRSLALNWMTVASSFSMETPVGPATDDPRSR